MPGLRKGVLPVDAERVAIDALTYLAGDPDRLSRFLALTGLGPDTLRAAASSPDFLASVLAHIVAHEPDLIACAEAIGVAPQAIVEAAERLQAGRG